jgi:hypothetical protein
VSTVENGINARLRTWGMTIDGFCVLANLCGSLPLMSKSAAHRALTGLGLPFGAQAVIALNQLISDIDAIIQAAHPLPLSLKNPAQVSQLVEAWREKSLRIDVQYN